jgi:hypothetical protein
MVKDLGFARWRGRAVMGMLMKNGLKMNGGHAPVPTIVKPYQ